MSRSLLREGVSVVALQLFCFANSDSAHAQSEPLPAVTVQAPKPTRPVTVHAGKKLGAQRASAKLAPAEVTLALKDDAVREIALQAAGLSERSLQVIRDMITSVRALEAPRPGARRRATPPAVDEGDSADRATG